MNQSSDFSTLNIKNYIYALVEYLVDRIEEGTKIHFDIQAEGIHLTLVQAVPLGLIIQEALTNAIAYAFPEGKGIVSVHMIRQLKEFILTISDNGVGLPDHYHVHFKDTFGLRLMEGLASQLGGYFKLENKSGVTIEVVFADIR